MVWRTRAGCAIGRMGVGVPPPSALRRFRFLRGYLSPKDLNARSRIPEIHRSWPWPKERFAVPQRA